MVEEVIEGKEDDTLQNKILRLKKDFDGEAIVVSFSCGVDDQIKLEMCMPLRRWNEDPDDNVDGDGPKSLPPRDFPNLQNEINYFG
tara:strand:+ start:527 stop:784 length:258 start_codon:yes stop_codon:yes gene_type:complete